MIRILILVLALSGCAGAPCTEAEQDTACKVMGGIISVGLSVFGGGGR